MWFLLLFSYVELFCFERGPRHYDWNVGKGRHLDCSTSSRIITWLWCCDKFRHALIQTYLLLAIDLPTSRAFEREVRLYKGEARASESSTCFPCRESHQVTSFWRELLRMLHAALPVKLSKYFSHLVTGFVRVLENLESHGNLKFQNPGLENLENMCWSLKVLEN